MTIPSSGSSPISLRQNWPLLLLFAVGVMGIGIVVGIVTAPDPEWFAELAKPEGWMLPDWAGGIIWLLLCVAFAVAGWRLWQIDSASVETRLWLAILIISWWFSPTFFVVRSPVMAFLVVALLLVLMVWFVMRTWRSDRVSALLFIPCTIYIAYVVAMTGSIVAMN